MSFLFVFSCNDDNSISNKISLDQTELTFDSYGGDTNVNLNTDDRWYVSNVPDWIHISHSYGESSQELTITIEPNKNESSRQAIIDFINSNGHTSLTIYQDSNKEELNWSSFNFSTFYNSSFTTNPNNAERAYNFSILSMFVNPSKNPNINQKIFLGNLINRKLNTNTDIEEYRGYTFNPITVYTTIGTEMSRTLVPSKTEQDSLVNLILSKNPSQFEDFYSNGVGIIYSSHRELHLLGKSNMGENLDSIVSGKSYKEQEMTKRNGIIYSFRQTLFSLGMDLQENITKEVINKNEFEDNTLSYISSVSYGRIGLLIIESDHSIKEIRSIVNKILQNKADNLSEQEKLILDEISVYHIYYDKYLRRHINKGKIDAIQKYKNQMETDLLNVFPFRFTVSDYFEQGESEMSFSMNLP